MLDFTRTEGLMKPKCTHPFICCNGSYQTWLHCLLLFPPSANTQLKRDGDNSSFRFQGWFFFSLLDGGLEKHINSWCRLVKLPFLQFISPGRSRFGRRLDDFLRFYVKISSRFRLRTGVRTRGKTSITIV